MSEWLFVLENPGIPGMIRVARSEDHPAVLVKKLHDFAASPFGYRIVFSIRLRNCFPILRKIMIDLCSSSASQGWHRITSQQVIPIILHQIAEEILARYRRERRGHQKLYDQEALLSIAGTVLCLNDIRFPDNRVAAFQELEVLRILMRKMKCIPELPSGNEANLAVLEETP